MKTLEDTINEIVSFKISPKDSKIISKEPADVVRAIVTENITSIKKEEDFSAQIDNLKLHVENVLNQVGSQMTALSARSGFGSGGGFTEKKIIKLAGEAGALMKQGVVTSDTDSGEGLYNLDASSAAFDFTLPAATGSQSRYLFAGGDLETNSVTIKVQAGERMNTVIDGVFVASTDGQVLLAMDNSLGEWDLVIIGAAQETPLHYLEYYTSHAGVIAKTVDFIDFDDATQEVTNDPFGLITLGTGVGGSDGVTVAHSGRYRIDFGAHGTGIAGTVEIYKNGVGVIHDPVGSSPHDSGNVFWQGSLVAGDFMQFNVDTAADFCKVFLQQLHE